MRKRDLLLLCIAVSPWAVPRPPQDNRVDVVPPGEEKEIQGGHWTLNKSPDCSGSHLTLTTDTDFKARVLDGQILLDPATDPPRFLVIQPILRWDTLRHYPIEYTDDGDRWK